MKMTPSEAGKLGAIASRETCKRLYNERVAKYYENPKLCLECHAPLTYRGNLDRYRFCNRSCSAIFNNKIRPVKVRECECGATLSKGAKKRCVTCQQISRRKSFEQAKSDPQRKKRLIEERGHKCENCKHSEWMGCVIPLELDHINGDHSNSSRDNLRLLCPTCHALTPTYKNKNKGKGRANRKKYYLNSIRPVSSSLVEQ